MAGSEAGRGGEAGSGGDACFEKLRRKPMQLSTPGGDRVVWMDSGDAGGGGMAGSEAGRGDEAKSGGNVGFEKLRRKPMQLSARRNARVVRMDRRCGVGRIICLVDASAGA